MFLKFFYFYRQLVLWFSMLTKGILWLLSERPGRLRVVRSLRRRRRSRQTPWWRSWTRPRWSGISSRAGTARSCGTSWPRATTSSRAWWTPAVTSHGSSVFRSWSWRGAPPCPHTRSRARRGCPGSGPASEGGQVRDLRYQVPELINDPDLEFLQHVSDAELQQWGLGVEVRQNMSSSRYMSNVVFC